MTIFSPGDYVLPNEVYYNTLIDTATSPLDRQQAYTLGSLRDVPTEVLSEGVTANYPTLYFIKLLPADSRNINYNDGKGVVLYATSSSFFDQALDLSSVDGASDGDGYGLGKQTIWIPAAAMTPTVTAGCAALTSVETTAGHVDLIVLDFDSATDEHAQFQVAFPKQWDKETVTYQAFWTLSAANTDGVAWALQGVAVSDDETIDVDYGTAVVVTDNNLGASNDQLVTAESAALTIAGTPADDDMSYFRVFRDVSDAADDATNKGRLIGIKLFFNNLRQTDN
jgi:hypothetical protein